MSDGGRADVRHLPWPVTRALCVSTVASRFPAKGRSSPPCTRECDGRTHRTRRPKQREQRVRTPATGRWTYRRLRLEKRVRARVESAIARVELKLTRRTSGVDSAGKGEGGGTVTYTGPEMLFEFWLICVLGPGGCALAMITLPVVGVPFVSPLAGFVVATKYCPC